MGSSSCSLVLALALIGPAQAMPLRFEANAGQADASIQFMARGGSGTVWLRGASAILQPRGGTPVRIEPDGRTGPAAPEGLEPLPSRSNYYVGRDPSAWRRGVPNFARVRYRHVWPGIDLVYYGNAGRLEYDFVIAPGADPNAILLAIHSDSPVRLTAAGDLQLSARITQHQPRIFQETAAGRKEVAGRYVLASGNRVRFRIGKYDPGLPLIVDPVISYATLVGGGGDDRAAAIAVDSAGSAYIAGSTDSSDLPAGVAGSKFAGAPPDIFVAKLTPDGTGLVYCTYLGGEAADEARAIAVDAAGNAYITGSTASKAFPATGGAFQAAYSGGHTDAFAAKLSPGGALLYATYFGGGGDEEGRGIAADADGNAYITGVTTSALVFPLSATPFQARYQGGVHDGFAARLNSIGTTLIYSTLLGSEGDDQPAAVAVDGAGNAYITGSTDGAGYPATAGAYQPSAPNPVSSAFVTKLNASGTPVYSTYLGGDIADAGKGIAVDAQGSAYVSGVTSSDNFPVTEGALQSALSGPSDAFAAKLNAAGSALSYSTLLGGAGDDAAAAIAIDLVGNAYVAGATQDARTDGTDGFVAKLDPAGAKLVYQFHLGGSQDDRATAIAVDPVSNAYVAGTTLSRDFPTTAGALRTNLAGVDSFVVKVQDVLLPLLSVDHASLSFSFDTLLGPPGAQTLQVAGTNGAVKFTAAAVGGSWLAASPADSVTPGSISVSVNPDRLAVGTYTGSIILTAPGVANSPLTVPVKLAVSRGQFAPPGYGLAPDTIEAGSGDTRIVIFGSDFSVNATVNVNGAAVQTVWVDAGTLNAVIPAALLASPGTLSITVANPAALTPALVISVVEIVPSVTADGVVNAASFLKGPVAPGEVILIRGDHLGPQEPVQAAGDGVSYPATLAGTRVLFDNVAAPLLYTSAKQAIAVVPFEIAPPQSTQMSVQFNGRPSNPLTLLTAPAAPGIFTLNTTGVGQITASNEDGSTNHAGNRAAPGTVVTFSATGSGQTDPAGVDGAILSPPLPALTLPVTVQMGGEECEVVSAGPMPGVVAGFLQITARVPEGVSGTVPVVLAVGGVASQPGATIEVAAAPDIE